MADSRYSAIESQIKAAMDRSSSHNEIVHVTITADSGDALTAINSLVECETDYAIVDYEGIDTMDVWGYEEDAPQGEMLWRLTIHFDGDDASE